jgi:hypothetical protein
MTQLTLVPTTPDPLPEAMRMHKEELRREQRSEELVGRDDYNVAAERLRDREMS